MKKIVIMILLLGFVSTMSFAQTMTRDDIIYVQAIRSIKNLKKQIKDKEQARAVAISAINDQFHADIVLLKTQLEIVAISIGLTLEDVQN